MEYTYNIIDSDASSKLQLQLYLEEYDDFVCASEDTNASAGLNSILKYNPDVVLVNLGEDGLSYFQMVTELNQYMQCGKTLKSCSMCQLCFLMKKMIHKNYRKNSI